MSIDAASQIKPNCEHKDENCNACVGFGLGYFDGSLYFGQLRDRERLLWQSLAGWLRSPPAN